MLSLNSAPPPPPWMDVCMQELFIWVYIMKAAFLFSFLCMYLCLYIFYK